MNGRACDEALAEECGLDYDEVMALLKTEIKDVFEMMEIGLLYMKIVKSDRHDYEPDFFFFS